MTPLHYVFWTYSSHASRDSAFDPAVKVANAAPLIPRGGGRRFCPGQNWQHATTSGSLAGCARGIAALPSAWSGRARARQERATATGPGREGRHSIGIGGLWLGGKRSKGLPWWDYTLARINEHSRFEADLGGCA